jgi:hypothetical protein
MGILFLVALLLAWPTFGLSIVAWFALSYFKGKAKAGAIEQRNERKLLIEPLFDDRFAEFIYELDLPLKGGESMSEVDAQKCGRLIMTYIAHNSEVGAFFMEGLRRWQGLNNEHIPLPHFAARSERITGKGGEIHLTCYKAIQDLIERNPNLRCFDPIDITSLSVQSLMRHASYKQETGQVYASRAYASSEKLS